MEWGQICQWMDYLDYCVSNRSSYPLILNSISAWIKPFSPINTRQGTTKQNRIVVLAQHNTDKPCIVC
jgi:hypothetical protein